MTYERFEDCDYCGERYEGEAAIRAYIREIDFTNAGGEAECLTVCIGCHETALNDTRIGEADDDEALDIIERAHERMEDY